MRRLLVLAACALSAGALTAVADGRPPGALKARAAALDLRLHVRHAPGDDFFRGTGEARRIGKAKVKYVRAVDGIPGEQAHTWRFRRGTIRATASVANVG